MRCVKRDGYEISDITPDTLLKFCITSVDDMLDHPTSHLSLSYTLGLDALASTYIQELKLRANPTVAVLNLAL